MYRMNRQMRIEDFVFPYGQLDKNNEWVKLADLVPWDEAEEAYAKQFVNNGHPAHPARIALGALIIKQRLNKQTSIGYTAVLKDEFDKEKNIIIFLFWRKTEKTLQILLSRILRIKILST